MGGDPVSDAPGNPIEALEATLQDVRAAAERICQWDCPPVASLVSAWAPLLNERLKRIEECLTECQQRLRPLQSAPVERSEDRIRPGMPMAEVERTHIAGTLRMMGGNREKAAKLLGMGLRTLYRKLNQYGIR
ncbi:MAG: hypothetical protein C4547_01380 [Phycisphaerales bacterium]|nr:MAG: hypothetical protein C4547_01380 [Phycisphaerales bacterium]